jgi:subtilisin-like proprotein convertase family protein
MRSVNGLLGLVILGVASALSAAPVNFNGTNTGDIPDNNPTGRTMSFNATGLASAISSVEVSLTLAHTFSGDLNAVLTAPGGIARMVLFGRIGTTRSNTNGTNANFAATYVFSDRGRPDLQPALQVLGTFSNLPGGTFRTLSRGAPTRSNAGGCPTSLRGVFGGLTPPESNGVWTLQISDAVPQDTGNISAAVLTIDTGGDRLFADGFDALPSIAAAPAHCINKVQADFTGDGLTDFAIARANGAAINWFIRENLGNGTASDTETTFNLGNPATDVVDSADLDGDRIADPLVWTEGAAGVAAFRARLSSRNGAVRTVVMGQNGDDSIAAGDNDGDAIDDLAIFRAPPFGSGDGPITLQFSRSSSGSMGIVQTGIGESGDQFPISGFDYSGDGIADIVVQETDTVTPANARFRVFNTTGTQVSTFVFGLASDFLIPGNFTGSSWTDITTRRTASGMRQLRTRDSQTGIEATMVVFGITNDSSIGGDYDGDGISDHGIWRGTPAPSKFEVRISSGAGNMPPTVWSLNFGQNMDFPIAGSRVR